MCLILLAYRSHPKLSLVVAANRDEFYARPTADAHFWADAPDLLAGKDLEAGGTWLGVTRSGRFAAVTNYAEVTPPDAPCSRGELTQNFLAGDMGAQDYVATLDGPAYRGYNLLVFDGQDLVYASNRAPTQVLTPGVYGLANATLNTAWPKVTLGTELLQTALNNHAQSADLLALLGDRTIPPDDQLPDTGRPLDLRRQTASCFIPGDAYGTRASTCLWISDDEIRFTEQNFGSLGEKHNRGDFAWPRDHQQQLGA